MRSSKNERRALEKQLAAAADPIKAANLAWFFKTGKGQYGEGDRFLGITVPALRRVALSHSHLSFDDLDRLLTSPLHEYRLAALEILVAQYELGTSRQRSDIFRFYVAHTARINNWDLVDASAPYIVGEHLKTRSRRLLDRLAVSANIWERRIAIVSTLTLLKSGETTDTFRIAAILIADKHDLIHKAVGWMLRESGKISPEGLLKFLKDHYLEMPRTALRYAIERFPPDRRQKLLAGVFDS